MTSMPSGDIPPHALLLRLERYLESHDALGFDVGEGRQIIDFLARLEMEQVESLLASAFTGPDRERVLNLVEERKGQLADHELPPAEAAERHARRGRT